MLLKILTVENEKLEVAFIFLETVFDLVVLVKLNTVPVTATYSTFRLCLLAMDLFQLFIKSTLNWLLRVKSSSLNCL